MSDREQRLGEIRERVEYNDLADWAADDVPWLLAEVERLENDLADARDELEHLEMWAMEGRLEWMD